MFNVQSSMHNFQCAYAIGWHADKLQSVLLAFNAQCRMLKIQLKFITQNADNVTLLDV